MLSSTTACLVGQKAWNVLLEEGYEITAIEAGRAGNEVWGRVKDCDPSEEQLLKATLAAMRREFKKTEVAQ